jgi:beta-aspartyl-dipeptidase (metallo-type)
VSQQLSIIRGARIFTPDDRGEGDVVIGGGQVLAMGHDAGAAFADVAAERIDARGSLLLPGLVDVLTHPCGGGGEGGFGNRTAEIPGADFIRAGVTSPVGALGTDSLGRSLEVLYGTVMGLRAVGLAAYMYSGAYRVPAPTLTGDIARDLYLVEPVIGVGEVAISDHRGTQPSAQELRRLAAETQLGGILAGAGGVVLVHVGDGPARLQLLRDAIADSDLPCRVLFPTHVNRSTALLDEAAEWAVHGGFVDITVSTTPELIAAGDIPALQALRRLLEAGAPPDRITMSSDAGGSLPLYVDGELVGLTAATSGVLLELLLEFWSHEPALFPIALGALTRNPAAALRLPDVGTLRVGGPADLVLFDVARPGLSHVFCRGRELLGTATDLAGG